MLAIVLGSGLNAFSECWEILKSKPFEHLFDISFEGLEGHERKYIWCRFGEEKFLIISGKLHFYEGHTFKELITPVKYAVENLGVSEIIVTSASGGLGADIKNGEWTYINRIFSIPEVNIDIKLRLPRDEKRVIMSDDVSSFSTLPKVTYAYHQGPSLGTNAEYAMLDYLDADLVGMSMYPEYCYLKSTHIISHFISIPVCNYYPFDLKYEPSFDEVLRYSNASIPMLVEIFKSFLAKNIT